MNGLLRGIAARIEGVEPEIEFAAAPPSCYVSSQRILCCLGSILQHVGIVAKEPVLDASIDAFVPHVGKVLRTLFARFRKDLGEGGLRDAEELLGNEEQYRAVLRGLGTEPTLTMRASDVTGISAAAEPRPYAHKKVWRIATWNIAGGHRSVQAPETYQEEDQRAAIKFEILRWIQCYALDVLALQECENSNALNDLDTAFELAGAVAAKETRGFVHLYVRKGIKYEVLENVDIQE